MSGLPEALLEPFSLFAEWFSEAKTKEPNDPNAMALATSDTSGYPDVRMVLMKDFSSEGVVFYTNKESQKGTQISQNPQASLLFHWKSLRRQVRFRGNLTEVSTEEADAYFATRARGSQIGAWASEQSRPLESRFALEKRVAEYGARHVIGTVPRPPHWSGFRLQPNLIEFWQDGAFRLHDRLEYRRSSPTEPWTTRTLYP